MVSTRSGAVVGEDSPASSEKPTSKDVTTPANKGLSTRKRQRRTRPPGITLQVRSKGAATLPSTRPLELPVASSSGLLAPGSTEAATADDASAHGGRTAAALTKPTKAASNQAVAFKDGLSTREAATEDDSEGSASSGSLRAASGGGSAAANGSEDGAFGVVALSDEHGASSAATSSGTGTADSDDEASPTEASMGQCHSLSRGAATNDRVSPRASIEPVDATGDVQQESVLPLARLTEQGRAESGSSSCSDDSDAGRAGPLGALAASMWAALQMRKLGGPRARNGVPAPHELAPGGATRKDTSGEPKKTGELSDGPAIWVPRTSILPAPRMTEAQEAGRTRDTETMLNKQLMVPPRDAKREKYLQKLKAKEKKWHDLPETQVTDDVRRDLRLLRLRGAMDPKRFYKKPERGALPKRFAIGTVIEGPAEFYSARLPKKQRRQSIAEELLADSDLQATRKRRFAQLQEEAGRWSRKKGKGSGERRKKSARRSKR